jgi:hypothetical protein
MGVNRGGNGICFEARAKVGGLNGPGGQGGQIGMN